MSGSARLPSRLEIDQIVSSQATTLLLACDEAGDAGAADTAGEADEAGERDSPIVGMLTLVMFRLPTGMRAWIDDVVVDSESRGRG